MNKNVLNTAISLILYGTSASVFAGAATIYNSGVRESASYLTFDERFLTSSSYVVSNLGTSVSAKYRASSPTSGSISIGNGAANGDTEAYMLIQNGASVSADQNVFIGSTNGLDSYINVTGSGSSLSSPQIRVGNADGGTNNSLNITDGGSVTAFDVYAGYGADGTINVQGEGSVLTVKPGVDATNTNFQQLTIGTDGHSGVLNVTNNATVNVVGNALLTIGGTGNSNGGTGILNITNGGVVNAGLVAVGNSIDSSDTSLIVTGTGSSLNAGTVYLGADNGSAKATIADGGKVSLSGQLVLGAVSSGSSKISIDDGGTLSVGGTDGISYGGSSNQPQFIMNGGTLQANLTTLTSNADMTLADSSISNFDSNGVGISLSGALNGSGSLRKSGSGILNLSGNNTYTGDTVVQEGTLQAGIENVISSSSSLSLAKNTVFDLGGYDQQVNSLSGEGNIILGDKNLSEINKVNSPSIFSGIVSGSGSLTKTGEGNLVLAGNNTYTGGTTINSGTLQLGNGGVTGSVAGDITNDGSLVFNRSNAMTYDGVISGSGDVVQAGSGTTTLTGNSTYTGATHIDNGVLKTAVSDAFANTSGVTIAENGVLNLGATSQTVNTLNNSGTLLFNDYGAQAVAQAVVLTGNVTNSGLVVINNGSYNAGQTLTVDGNWVGNGGTVSIGTVLGGDDSLTDKLAITGSASGTTYVAVSNEGGSGAQTLEGINVVSTGSSTRDAFVQKGRIVAGSYEYHLQQGTTSGANTNNWYLTSQSESGNNGGSGENGNNGNNGNNSQQTYRPERGSYAANLAAAATMFTTRLNDRQSGGVYVDPLTGERYPTSLWMRTVGGHNEGKMSDGQSNFTANRMVYQLGGDVLSGALGNEDALHIGVMAGYGKQSSKTRNSVSGYASRGTVEGYSTGLYGTWYQNEKDKTGLYVDSWMLYSWFNNRVKGDELAYEKYKSKGLTASIESGYIFHAGSYLTDSGMENNVYIRPQAQVLWLGVKANDHTEQNGTRIEGKGNDNVQTRLGVRLSMTGQSRLDKGSVRKFEPFIEANWVYTAKEYGVKMGDASSYIRGSRNVAEVKTGVEGQVSEHLSVWGNVGQQFGNSGYRDTQGMLGVKYAF